MSPIEIKFNGTEYEGFHFGKLISKAKSLEKVLKKLYNYVKGQS